MSTHDLQSEKTEEQCSFNMFNDTGQPQAEAICSVLKVNNSELKMEVDTRVSGGVGEASAGWSGRTC